MGDEEMNAAFDVAAKPPVRVPALHAAPGDARDPRHAPVTGFLDRRAAVQVSKSMVSR